MEYTIFSNQISPFVRYAEIRNIERISLTARTYAKDWRIFSVIKGKIKIFLEDNVFSAEEGDTVLIPPMQLYRLENNEKVLIYIINFDMLPFDSDINNPIPMLRKKTPEDSAHQTITFKDLPQLMHATKLNLATVQIYFSKICELYKKNNLYSRTQITAYLTLALTQIFELMLNKDKNGSIANIFSYINEHYNEKITNQSIAEQFHYHPNYVNRLFVNYTGQSLHQYIMEYRIKIATELLLSTDLSIANISERTGWHSPSHFSRSFKQITGFNPTSFKQIPKKL